MKKLLLSLMTAVLALGATAANITEDFTVPDNNAWLPTAASNDAVTKTSPATGIAYTMANAYAATNYDDATKGYLMLKGKSVTPKGYLTFKLPIACSEIKVLTGASASTSVQVNVKAGDTEIVPATTLSAKATVFSLQIPAAYQAAGTEYTIAVTNSYNAQFQTIEYVEATSDATLEGIITGTTHFAAPLNGTMSATLGVKAANLPGDITVSVTGEGFSLESSTLAVNDAATGARVIYTGTAAGIHTGMLTYTSGALKVEYLLEGYTAAHAATQADPLTATEVVAMNSLWKGPGWIAGTINAQCAANAKDGVIQLAETLAASNVVIGDGTSLVPVALPTGDIRSAVNIVDNTANVGKTLAICGDLVAYFLAPGLKNPTDYTLDGQQGVKTTAKPYFTPAAGEVEAGTEVQIKTATSGAAIFYTTNGTEPSLTNGTEFDPGDPIVINAAVTIKAIAIAEGYDPSEIAEAAYTLKQQGGDQPASQGTVYDFQELTGFTPAIGTPSEDNGWEASMSGTTQNGWVYILDDKTLTAGQTSLTFAKGEASTSCRVWQGLKDGAFNGKPDVRIYKGSTMTLKGAEKATVAITGNGLTKNSALLFTVTGATIDEGFSGTAVNLSAVTGDVVVTPTGTCKFYTITISSTSGLADLATDDNAAPVEYYNLQGQRVLNPAAGTLVIRRQGTTATKVLVK